MRRSSLTQRMKVKEAAETQPVSRKPSEPKLKERKREKKRRRKVRRKQKVSIHFFFSLTSHPTLFFFLNKDLISTFHLPFVLMYYCDSYDLKKIIFQ